MLIRLMRAEDIPHAALLIGKNYSEEWERRAVPELNEMFGTGVIKPTYYICEDKDKIIGLAGFIQSWMDYNIFQIFWVNVDPERQRAGIGKELVWTLIEEIKKSEEAALIQLTTDSPHYYSAHFGFKVVDDFVRGTYQLMTLSVEDPSAVYEKHLANFYDGDRSLWTKEDKPCRHCSGQVWVRTIDIKDDRSLEDRVGACEGCGTSGSLCQIIDLEIGY
jgi:N-acetylglutamate synthase-like GNAT family acetyltransferase